MLNRKEVGKTNKKSLNQNLLEDNESNLVEYNKITNIENQSKVTPGYQIVMKFGFLMLYV